MDAMKTVAEAQETLLVRFAEHTCKSEDYAAIDFRMSFV
jgi:hypothetical protein